MPTEAEIDRLQGLITQLGPLAKRVSGDLIRSAEWDLVVDSLIAVARAQVAEQAESVKAHEHPDQVSVGWLDPKLRGLVEGGPLSDPAQVARLAEVERRTERFEGATVEIRDETKQLRELLHELSARDLERQAAFTELRRLVENLGNAKDDVLALRQTLQVLDTKVQDAVEIGAALRVDGQIVQIGGVVDRLDQLAELRERLTMPTGEVLDAAEFQKQLAKLRTESATQEDVDEALKLRPVELPPEERAKLEEALEARLASRVEASSVALKAEIVRATDERLGEVDAKVARAVGDLLPTVSEGILETIRPEIASAAETILEKATVTTSDTLAEAAAALRLELRGELENLESSLPNLIGSELGLQLSERLGGIEESMSKLSSALESVDTTLASYDASLGGLSARIEAIANEGATTRLELQQAFEAKLAAEVELIRRDFDQRQVELAASFDTALATTRTEILAETKNVVSDEVAGMRDALPTLIDAELASSTRITQPLSPTFSPTIIR